ncbi:phosphoinositide 3-kinase regulatory subunit 4 [Moniliophthora roreri MCA 2997]|uniref:non-specific serine/threonine protein kinase n=1 Tax=Moniliophthora roreri (strain MCA 2997) TaxID=1381753 RepID=V2XXZ5_MONRO|nr:phosphoinositide 3-kinase regulatory subunit 4 [Moniliophthora roreri MCA 2997]
MGNVQSGSMLTRTTGALDSFVSELGGDIEYERSLGSARFLKTVKCKHRNGYLVIKIFIKPDPGVTLRTHLRRLKVEREALLDISNVYNYQAFVETDKAGYIVRQWIASNLYDRISTRPFLSTIEKKWITFQVLTGLRDARNRKISHGDIKSENILVTSWNWVYLSDFAPYKPVYLPLDDPSDFSFFFDTSGRRTCYIAPERFYTASSNPEISAKKSKIALEENDSKRDGRITEAMDCFSVGCVIAELFLEGAPLFTLAQLFKYREGDYNLDTHLNAIEDEGVQNMIKQMIHLDPAQRPTFDSLLHMSRGSVFPECFFSFLHNYVSSINELPASPPFISTAPPGTATTTSTAVSNSTVSSNRTIQPSTIHPGTTSPGPANDPLPSDSDHRMERLWADFESVEPYITAEVVEEPVMDVKVDYNSSASASKPFQDVLPVELHIPNRDSKLSGALQPAPRATMDGPALIILALISSNIRNCSLPTSKVRALDVFLALCPHLTDEAKLDRIVPYIVDLLHDDAAIVRAAAVRTLVQVLMLVTVITPSNAAVFPEYIIPNIKYVVQDPEVSVRCAYAQCLVQLADTAVRYLEMGQALKAHGSFKLLPDAQEYDNAHYEVSYEVSMQDLQNSIQEHLSALLMDPSSIVKRAVLHDISYLCIFLRQRTNDVILSHMITYLNDRDWLLRLAFFESIVDVAACAGGRSLDEYILPLMIQALSGAAAFIASAANHLPASDVWCILYPSLRHFLKSDVAVIDEQSLLTAMKTPLPRPIFDAAVQWAQKADKASFWRGSKKSSRTESARESVASMRRTGTSITRNMSEDDEAHVAKLQQLGMNAHEEVKLIAMRDYILKLANAISSFASRLSLESDSERHLKVIGDIELPKLGVVPQTVFLKSSNSDNGLRSTRISRKSYDSVRPPMSPSQMTRISSEHAHPNVPFEDLRRRLATINGSTSSLSVAQTPSRSPLSPLAVPPASLAGVATSPVAERPGSPTESVVSTTNSTSFRPLSRMQMGTSTDTQKAAPAIGSSKTNALGLLDSHTHLRTETSPERSGRSSPLSMSQTIRPAPRLRVSSVVPISTYDGQDAGISHLLENLYLDNNRELQNDFGPRVHEGPIRRRNPVRHSFVSRDGSAKKMETTLVAHLGSHSESVTGLAVSPDHMFFVSSSDDKTVKVWDTARLERNVTSKPRHTYGQHHARVKCVCALEGVHCFASAADDGSLHIVRVHITQGGPLPKYNKLQVIREHRVDNIGEYITSMVHYNTDSTSNLIYATTHSVITTLDLRTMRVLQSMENPRHFGPITCICLDRKRCWILVGTSTGVLSLWDRRFGLLLKSWHIGVASTGRSVRIHQVVIHPSKGRGKWVMVTVEGSKKMASDSSNIVIEVWDIEKAILMETFVVRRNSGSDAVHEPVGFTGVDADTSPSAAIDALVRLRQAGDDSEKREAAMPSTHLLPVLSADVRAIAVGMEFGGHSVAHRSEFADLSMEGSSSRTHWKGFVITGSDDRKIRLWDLGKIERSTVLCGSDTEHERPSYSSVTNGSVATHVEAWPLQGTGSQSNRPQQRMSLISHTQHNLLNSHQDIITALICIDSPFRCGIISGDRTGVIKVWRVDIGEQ